MLQFVTVFCGQKKCMNFESWTFKNETVKITDLLLNRPTLNYYYYHYYHHHHYYYHYYYIFNYYYSIQSGQIRASEPIKQRPLVWPTTNQRTFSIGSQPIRFTGAVFECSSSVCFSASTETLIVELWQHRLTKSLGL